MAGARTTGLAAVIAMAVVAAALPATAGQPGGTAEMSTTAIRWTADRPYASAQLTVTGPGDFLYSATFSEVDHLELSLIDLNHGTALDGQYTYELRFTPLLDEGTRASLVEARRTGDATVVERLWQEGRLPAPAPAISGSFRLVAGAIVTDAGEGEVGQNPVETVSAQDSLAILAQVFTTDVIVQGSECVGLDCASSESFGFDTLRLKENNLRINFDDTSTSASFPNNDWRLTANDSANGGRNRFSIEDATGGKEPFTIIAGAPTGSLHITSAGNVGLGTSTPVVEVHVVDGDSPTLRLEQDGSSGFAAQTWDVAGNEAGFFVRDASNGSTLPLRIRPGAPQSSVDIAGSGNVGIGTASPAAKLDVNGTALVSGDTGIGDSTTPANLDVSGDTTVGGSVGIGTTTPAVELDVVGAANISGDVGIGTTTPTAKLDVNGGANIAGNVGIGTTAPTAPLDVNGPASIAGSLGVGTATPTAKLDVNGGANVSGNVGIGTTTPAAKLDVAGAATIAGNLGVGTSTPSANLDVVGGANVGGNLGIGTAAPAKPLDVNGDAIVRGDLTVTGTVIGGVDLSAFQAGVVSLGSFVSVGTGRPFFKANVRLRTPLASYAVVVTAVTSNVAQNLIVTSKTSTGFTIATDSLTGLVEVDWLVQPAP